MKQEHLLQNYHISSMVQKSSKSAKVNQYTNKSGVKDPSISTWELAQLDRHGTGNTTVIGSRVQSLLEVTFFLNSFFSNTILADLTEWSIYGKPRLLHGKIHVVNFNAGSLKVSLFINWGDADVDDRVSNIFLLTLWWLAYINIYCIQCLSCQIRIFSKH